MTKFKEFMVIIGLVAMIMTAFFGSLVEADWLEPYCLISVVITLILGAFRGAYK